MNVAGELDDRWLALSLPQGGGRAAGGKSGHHSASTEKPLVRLRGSRVKGNAPGNARGCESVTESATENKPPRKKAAVTGGRETCSSSVFKSAFAGKGETVG